MRSCIISLVVCAVISAIAATALAGPVQVINEKWVGWSGDPNNEPLDFDVHLGDPNIVGALNNTNNLAYFVSSGGYVFTNGVSNEWAFSVRSALAPYLDFTRGTNDLSFSHRNNAGGQFRILLSQSPGSGYFVSDEFFGAVGDSSIWTTFDRDLDTMTWNTFDPTTMTMDVAATPDFTAIREVGFASLVTTATERLDNIVAYAVLVPEPTALVLMALGLPWLGMVARRRRSRQR